jgi:hypothetical protein
VPTELNLRFPGPDQVIVRLGSDDDGSGALPFVNPIADRDLQNLQWYVEVYGAHSLGDPDDEQARRIAGQHLVGAIRRILAGERDEDALCDALDSEDSMVVDATLRGLEDPSSLDDLQPNDERKSA